MTDLNTNSEGPGVLAQLRALAPRREMSAREAMHVATLQAERLLRLHRIDEPAVPVDIVGALPHITVESDPDLAGYAASGSSDWDSTRRSWVISYNPVEPVTRQRFTVFHELKHIIDHGTADIWDTRRGDARPAAEFVADYFAACVLMPRTWIKSAYFDGIQRPRDLAEIFNVSIQAMCTRLLQLGLSGPTDDQPQPTRHYRLKPSSAQSANPTKPAQSPSLTLTFNASGAR